MSPSLITREPALSLYVWLASMGSSEGSRISSTFSSSMGLPSRMHISRVCCTRLAASLALHVFTCALACDSLMKRLAWPCGSIMSGQRLVDVMMMPG